jgi:hypothetical protein
MEQIDGIPTEIAVDGRVLRKVKALGMEKPVYGNLYLLSSEEAGRLFLEKEEEPVVEDVEWRRVKEAGAARKIAKGTAGVAEQPSDEDFAQAAVYIIDLPAECSTSLLRIDYRGDVARLYADGKLIEDNFYNGRPLMYGLWRLPADCRRLELRILPLQKDMPVYFPPEAKVDEAGEAVNRISLVHN